MINVTERIREIMELKGWSPYELSIQTDIATNAIYDWFKNGAVPNMQSIIKICNAAEMTLEEFFCGKNPRYTDEENEMLRQWAALSDLEKSTIKNLMETFRILKNG